VPNPNSFAKTRSNELPIVFIALVVFKELIAIVLGTIVVPIYPCIER